MGSDGNWNRAGRRSGGDRPFVIAGSPPIKCSCGTETPFGLLETVWQRDAGEMKQCPNCHGFLFIRVDGRWVSAEQVRSEMQVWDKDDDADPA